MAPRIGSAGCEGHHPTTMLLFPFWWTMFHSALVLRPRLLMGRTLKPSGVGSVKPKMPCLGGRLPVAMEVHTMGLSGG